MDFPSCTTAVPVFPSIHSTRCLAVPMYLLLLHVKRGAILSCSVCMCFVIALSGLVQAINWHCLHPSPLTWRPYYTSATAGVLKMLGACVL